MLSRGIRGPFSADIQPLDDASYAHLKSITRCLHIDDAETTCWEGKLTPCKIGNTDWNFHNNVKVSNAQY